MYCKVTAFCLRCVLIYAKYFTVSEFICNFVN